MARMRFNHNSFSTGILSKKAQGNADFEGYNNALDECVNFQIQHTGGLFKRGGSYFVAETFNSEEAELILFSYSAEDTYVCEFTDKYVRFFTKYGILKKEDGTDVEMDTELSLDDMRKTKTFQDGNILNLVTPNGIYQLKRVSTTKFTIEKMDEYTSMPLTFMNTENIGLKPSKESGEIEIKTVNPKIPTNKPNSKFTPVFYDSDKDNYLVLTYIFSDGKTRIYFLLIKNVLDDESGFKKLMCTIEKSRCVDPVLSDDGTPKLPNLEHVTRWQVSAFAKDRGIPKAAATYEGRLFLANNSPSYPTGIWGSSLMYDDMFDFYTSSNSADAVQFKVNMQQADELLWLAAQTKLFAGTKGGIYIAGAASYNDEAITPANFRIRLLEAVGVSPLQPVVALDSVFFVDSSEKNVHEIILSADTGAYKANDVSLLANDLTQSGIVAHTWQQTPIKTYWCAVKDGYLCALTYLKNNGILAWSKHVIAGNNVKINSLCTIVGDKSDLVFMVVQREINREIKRYIEYIHPMYDPLGQEEFKQFYVDSGITKQIKHTITDIQRSENTHVTTDMSDFFNKLDEFIVAFKSVNISEHNPLKAKNSYIAKNVTKDGFDLYSDLRIYNSKIKQGKLNPLDWNDDSIDNVNTFIKIANIIGVNTGNNTFIMCDTRFLNDDDEIIIMRSFVKNKEKIILDYEITGLSFKVLRKTITGFSLQTNDGNLIVSDYANPSIYAEVFKKYNPVTDFNIGTNAVISLKHPIINTEISGNLLKSTYGNNMFVCISVIPKMMPEMSLGIFWTSLDDGKTWSETSRIDRYDIKDISYGNGRFIAVGIGFDLINSSFYCSDNNGHSWQNVKTIDSILLKCITYGNGRFIAIGRDVSIFKCIFWTSLDDGKTWSGTLRIDDNNITDITYGNDRFIMVENKNGDSIFWTSLDDGETWSETSRINSFNIKDITYGNDRFIAIGDTEVWYSTNNGKTWIISNTRFVDNLITASYGNDKFVILGSGTNGIIKSWHSIDGKNWIDSSADIILYINKVHGMTQINNDKYKIAWKSRDGKQIVVYDSKASPDESAVNVVLDSYDYYEYDSTVVNNGNAYEYFNKVEGLNHLEGQEVSVCSNGNTASPDIVKDGEITLGHDSMYCSVGLPMKAWMKTVPFSGGSVLGSSVGSVGSQKSMYMYLYYSLGGKYGAEKNNVFPVPYQLDINLNKPTNLITGVTKCPMINASNPTDRSVYIEHDDPLSFNILSITQDIQVSDA